MLVAVYDKQSEDGDNSEEQKETRQAQVYAHGVEGEQLAQKQTRELLEERSGSSGIRQQAYGGSRQGSQIRDRAIQDWL